MKHARNDYSHIIDNTGKIPIDEPVFLLRGKDKLTPATIRFWIDEYMAHGGDTHNAKMLELHVQKIEKWQDEKGGAYPTIPIGSMDDDPNDYMTILMVNNKAHAIESYPTHPSPMEIQALIDSCNLTEEMTNNMVIETMKATPQIKRLFSHLV